MYTFDTPFAVLNVHSLLASVLKLVNTVNIAQSLVSCALTQARFYFRSAHMQRSVQSGDCDAGFR
jgi:hypothetical protein